jgi:hypothetical protein
MKKLIRLMLLVFSLLPTTLMRGADKEDPWVILKHTTHRSTLAFMVRGEGCYKGKIRAVADDSIRVKLQSGATITIERSTLVRVEGYAVGAIYSGTSSWADVKAIRSDLGERARVVAKDGNKYEGKAQASDTEITVEHAGKNETILKSNVARVDRFTDRPASDSLDSFAQEGGGLLVLDPEAWVYMAQKASPLSVRIYDSSLPEDNTRVSCQP